MAKHTLQELKQWQSLPLSVKVLMTRDRIRSWIKAYGEDGVYISFSGGKDSTVLLDLVRNKCGYTDVPAVFVDVPTQYPELRDFAKTFDNVVILRPKMSFMEVCEKYGFPLISKEVSESVHGAKRYLTFLRAEKAILTDRQTDRQTDHPYRYWYDRVTGQGKYQRTVNTPSWDEKSLQSPSMGGYDRKYRRLRGIGEFAKRTNGETHGRSKSEACEPARMENQKSNGTDKGEYP